MQRPSVVSILAMAVRTEAAVGLCRLRPVPLAVVAGVALSLVSALEAVASLPRCLYVGFTACQLAVANIQALSHARLAQAAVSRASVGQTKRGMDRQQAESCRFRWRGSGGRGGQGEQDVERRVAVVWLDVTWLDVT
ncbi:hypothetical protein BC831DRAFT_473459 [Entophlyctis helioformis]|nr:hypothetical protein BC831DRAFT_473459 [Entophlyctis helioformis]